MPQGVQVQILFRAPKRCEMNELEYPKNATDEEKIVDEGSNDSSEYPEFDAD